MNTNQVRVISFYLPQYHPIPENDKWWGKGFTEWTNVGKAKPLFIGHYQPKVPADLGYYDLRLPEARIAQASLAKQYGIEGFCYWHYWFGNGKRLLERPFDEVLKSGEPDFPFCLAWANHSWEDKQFKKGGTNKLLIEQLYPGKEDHILHFNTLLPAFKDKRYIKVDEKPLFYIYSPLKVPNIELFIMLWNDLAKRNGLKGIHFVTQTHNIDEIEILRKKGFDAVNIIRLFHFFKKDFSFVEKVYMKIVKKILRVGQAVDYERASKYFSGEEDKLNYCYPTIIPNWDHSPRSGRNGHILIKVTPEKFRKHVRSVINSVLLKEREHRLIFLRSWNEWGEGNYIEPDLKFGRSFLEVLKNEIENVHE